MDGAFAAREWIAAVAMAVIARTVRRAFPGATEMSVRAEDHTVTAVFAGSSVAWTEHDSELPGELHFELVAYLTDLQMFWRATEALADLGWVESTGVFTVPLPPGR
jgi:hypothetical protein